MTDQRPTDTPAGDDTLVGISFGDAFRAQEFFTAVARLASRKSLTVVDAVFVQCDEDGNTKVRETVDPTPGRSALSGGAWAGLFGLILGGPVGWLIGTGIGAGSGALMAKAVDHGIPDEWVDWFRNEVLPGRTLLAIYVRDLDRAALVDELERFEGAQLVYANVDPLWLDRMREALGEEVDVPVEPTPGADEA